MFQAYSLDGYNDFNTFYIQAASNTSGGSSGSPVINIDGQAVALNAGGKGQAASSFYLPLDRVKRALACVQRGEAVPRGTLQTTFKYTPYNELNRLGLSLQTQAMVRQADPNENGMLVVESIVPGGPAHNVLQQGDILVRIGDKLVTKFIPMEEILDDSVGTKLTFTIERGGSLLELQMQVQDLHSITPSEMLEFSGGSFNALSYQQARNWRLSVGLVYVFSGGFVFGKSGIGKGSIVTHLGQEETPTLARFAEILAATPTGKRVRVRYFHVSDRYQQRVGVVAVDHRWHAMKLWRRDDSVGKWIPTLPLLSQLGTLSLRSFR